jgi:HlyD family secretion protein
MDTIVVKPGTSKESIALAKPGANQIATPAPLNSSEIAKPGPATDSTAVAKSAGNQLASPAPSDLSKTKLSKPSPALRDWKYPAALGYALIIFTFGVLGGWSALARLDSAVTAPGSVTEENSRKSVQHFEGGMISAILVREGEHVKADQSLFKLDPTQAQASLDIQRDQLDSLLAQEARLLAERDRAQTITWPQELESKAEQPNVKQAIADQTKQFANRQASLHGQTDVLESKIDQLKTQIQGLQTERDATQKQLEYIVQELNDLEYLLSENLVQKSRVYALQREKSRLQGVIGQSVADEAKAGTAINEARLEIQQVQHKFDEDVAGSISEVRQKINDTRSKIQVARDVFRRLDIKAPVSGTIQDLKVFTIGGVIKPGETLLEIVPDNEDLIVQAHVSPEDISRMWPGMQAEVRFPSFRSSLLPIIMGRVESVSRDRLVDEAKRTPYFLAQVVVHDVPPELEGKLVAGMPAELVFPTGERTVLNYLVRPLEDRLHGAMRER